MERTLPRIDRVARVWAVALGLLVFTAAAAHAQVVTWADGSIEHTTIPGGEASLPTKFTVSKKITEVKVLVQPVALKPFVSVSKTSFLQVGAGGSKTITLSISVPDAQALGKIDGKIAIKGKLEGDTDAKVLSQNLPVTLDVVEPARLSARTFFEDEPLQPGPAKTKIFVDGELVGKTKGNGRLNVDVVPGSHRIAALIPFDSGAATTAKLVSGKTKIVNLVLTGAGLTQVEDYDLVLLKSEKGLLPADFASFSFQLQRPDGTAIVVDSIDGISVFGIAPGSASDSVGGDPLTSPTNLTNLFELVQNGRVIKASDADALRSILSGIGGQMQIDLAASSLKKGMVYEDFVTLQLGSFTLAGKLAAPPSKPGLAVGNLPVKITLLNTDTSFTVKSKANGSFAFPTALPLGSLNISAEKKDGSKFFSGQGTIFMDSDKNATINLLATKDVLNGVPEIVVTSATSALSANAAIDTQDLIESFAAERAQLDAAQPPPPENAEVPEPAPATASTISVVATGAGSGVNVVVKKTLTVPAGVAFVTLTYDVSTIEWPFYVQTQSVFDDVWSLTVRDQAGKSLFSITRSVNSQWKNLPPLWLPDGSTGKIIHVIKVPGAVGSTRKLTLIAASKNVSDGALATTVDAKLSTKGAKLNFILSQIGVNPFMSIPRQNDRVDGGNTVNGVKVEKNTFHKSLRATVDSPDDFDVADLTLVKVAIVLGSSAQGGKKTIISEGGIGGPVVKKAKNKFNSQVTFGALHTKRTPLKNDNLNLTPPAHNIQYEMTVKAMVDGDVVTAPVQSRSGIVALWRMPDIFERYSIRDKGGDDWASQGTYAWMVANKSKLTKIGDITGEHGRHTQLGHATHSRGTDIDMYHFGAVLAPPAAGQPFLGRANIDAATALAVAAVNGDAAAKATLKTWIEAQRAGAQALVLLPTVAELICPKGSPDGTGILPPGWFEDLFKTGKFEATDGLKEVDIGGGFTSGKLKFRFDHNHHYHIDLNDSLLTKSP